MRSKDYILSEIQLTKEKAEVFWIRADVADYFGISGVVPTATSGHRSAYSYTRYSGADSTTGTQVSVGTSRFSKVPGRRKQGRKVRVPTEHVSERGNPKTLGICFPVRAKQIAIAHWLATHCEQNIPSYFISEAGKTVKVLQSNPEFWGE